MIRPRFLRPPSAAFDVKIPPEEPEPQPDPLSPEALEAERHAEAIAEHFDWSILALHDPLPGWARLAVEELNWVNFPPIVLRAIFNLLPKNVITLDTLEPEQLLPPEEPEPDPEPDPIEETVARFYK